MPSSETSRRAMRVWRRLTEWYGARIVDQYGEEPPADWRRAVDRSPDPDIQRALAECRAKHVSFPPTLPEFEALLRPRKTAASRRATMQERLVDYVLAHRNPHPDQLAQPWTFLHGGSSYAGTADFRVTGVVVPAAGGHAEIRVMAEDIGMEDAA